MRKKGGSPKKPRKQPDKRTSIKSYLLKSGVGLIVLLILVVTAGYITHQMISRKESISPLVTKKEKTPHTAESPKKQASRLSSPTAPVLKKKPPVFEVFPSPEPKPIKPEKIPRPDFPKVAIIIDDLGYDPFIAQKFLQLDSNLTFAIIPHTPFQKKIAEAARKEGRELMVHLPMEPNEYPQIDPGPGALLTSMSPDCLIEQLRKDLDVIPDAIGVNSHMGSRLTTESTKMYQVFSILKKRNLFFIDSFTTPLSVCKSSARLLRLPFAQRDVFIDHQQESPFIRRQMHQLVQIAQKHGEAVGIAHPYNVTLSVLQEMLPEIKKSVQIVPASQVVQIVDKTGFPSARK